MCLLKNITLYMCIHVQMYKCTYLFKNIYNYYMTLYKKYDYLLRLFYVSKYIYGVYAHTTCVHVYI